MQYLLMIYADEAGFAARTPAEAETLRGEYAAFTQQIVKSGHLKGGDRLFPSGTGTTVRVRDGKPLLTDGPYAETREQLGGYYIVEARDLDEATAIAARIPAARTGAIEVRRIDLDARLY